MAKKQASDELGVGSRIRVKPGTALPEFPETVCGGWTGSIVETTGKKPNTKYVIEWDDATIAAMPAEYLKACEAQGLYYRMACFDAVALDRAT